MSLVSMIYYTLMIGFMSGAIAKYLTPKLKQGDMFVTMTVGLIGSVAFAWLGGVLKFYQFGEYRGLFSSFIGACLFLLIHHFYMVKKLASRSPPKT